MRLSLGAPRLESAARGSGAATLLVAPRAVAAAAQPLRRRRAALAQAAAPSAVATGRPRRAPLPARFQKEDRQQQPPPPQKATAPATKKPLPGPAPRALDANEAVATVAFKCVDASFVYPITPSTPGAEKLSELAATPGATNAWGTGVECREMQSESGVAGALHGALAAGSLVSTFTCSQGLLLMIPELYKLAGEALPAVLHVAARSLAGASLSIFGGHDDVLAAKQSGAAVLFSSSVQEAADQALVAHLAALRGSLPVLHAYDGFRTSHELTTIEPLEVGGDTPQGQALRALLVDDPRSVAARAALRRRALDPARPSQRGTAQGPDVFFQQQEAANARHRAFAAEVELAMKQVAAITGRPLAPFSYVGDEDAEEVVVAMGSGVAVAEAAATWLNERKHLSRRVGVLGVRLYRPWSAETFLAALPATTKRVAVLERCKDVQALGEPLFLDVAATLAQRAALQGVVPPVVVGGRYGLGSKDFTPAMAVAVFDHLAVIGGMNNKASSSSSSSPYSPERLAAQGHHHAPPSHGFTVGIVDDVTHTSLPLPPVLSGNPRPSDLLPKGTVSCLFYGLGGDGTVGANHEAIRICGGSEGGGMRAQAYFAYGAAKSGGLTTTHMRLTPGGQPLDRVPYLVGAADYVGVHGPRYLAKYGEAIASRLKAGGTLLINTRATTIQELESEIPPLVREKLAQLKPRLFVVDARAVAEAAGLGKRVNAVLQAAFFALSGVIQPLDRALDAFKASIARLYGKKGPKVVEQNVAAVDAAVGRIVELSVPDDWGAALETAAAQVAAEVVAAAAANNGNGNGKKGSTINPWGTPTTREQFIERVVVPALQLRGDELPVSALALSGVGGAVPSGTSAIEKRGLAEQVPAWHADLCSQCGLCSFVCPHAAIRPFLATPEEARAAPAAFNDSAVPLRGGNKNHPLVYKMQVSPMDCTGCALCVHACPDHALTPTPLDAALASGERDAWDWAVNTPSVAGRGGLLFDPSTVRGSQFHQPLLEFSGACEGCGETPYVKLLTQMAGETAVIANATGCSSIWGGGGVTMPYTVNSLSGRGPAWGNALFEDNAEFAYGIELGLGRRRDALAADVQALLEDSGSPLPADLRAALEAWLPVRDDHDAGPPAAAKLAALLAPHAPPVVPPPLANANAAEAVVAAAPTSLLTRVAAEASMLWPLQTFAVSGDGAAYDIGAAGLEHVLADPSARLRALVLDNGMYANTGGQASKATPLGAVAKLAPAGEARPSREMALEFAATYPHLYVATVCLEASPSQCVRAFAEAMAHKGPALIIAYTPCALQGIEGGMGCSLGDAKAAVDAGFVQLWRRAPGKRLALDSGKKEPEGGWEAALEAFLSHENRFGQLARKDPEAAARLHRQLAGQAARRRRMLSLLQQASEADAAEAAGGDAPTAASR
jgi:pyruvate-ferredoxin/flavodoxin oxidoreductase